MQLTHFLSHIDALAEAGGVYQATSKTALQMKASKRKGMMLLVLVEALFILVSWIGWKDI